jgi:TonB family protein
MAYRLRVMTPGAVHEVRERNASHGAVPERPAARVSWALGASVVLHVLGALALWGGASEPEPTPSGRPLEVELVWHEVAERGGTVGVGQAPRVAPTGGPAPGSAVRPDPARRGREKADVPRPVEEAATPGAQQAATTPEEAPAEVPAASPAEAPSALESQEPGSAPALAVRAASSPSGPEGASTSGGAPGGGAGGGADSELLAYREQLSRRVKRQRRHLSQVARFGMEGTALVRVRINHDGTLATPPRLEGSSSFRVLDAEALRMVEAAAPFAPLPSELSRESVEFVIPVSFSVRDAAG